MSEASPPQEPPHGKPLNVLVAGISGQQGGHVARHLLRRGHKVRGLARDLDNPKLTELRSKGVEVVKGTFDDPASVENAARGVDAMFLMGTPFRGGAAQEQRQGIAAVDAAHRAGVPWLVYSSVGDADRKTGIPHFDSKFAVEQHLRASGVPSAVSAPTAFMENFVSPFQLPGLREGRLSGGTSPDRKVQMVALDDLAAFVTVLLENPSRFRGRRTNVASDAVSQSDAAHLLTGLLRRPVVYQQIPIEMLRSQSADTAAMIEWFERDGYTADIEALRREFPNVGWQRFPEWAARQDWSQLLK
jgi:uncharacterized protein YbjT (DUF2867 family)